VNHISRRRYQRNRFTEGARWKLGRTERRVCIYLVVSVRLLHAIGLRAVLGTSELGILGGEVEEDGAALEMKVVEWNGTGWGGEDRVIRDDETNLLKLRRWVLRRWLRVVGTYICRKLGEKEDELGVVPAQRWVTVVRRLGLHPERYALQ
jgi:hypothetical protein